MVDLECTYKLHATFMLPYWLTFPFKCLCFLATFSHCS